MKNKFSKILILLLVLFFYISVTAQDFTSNNFNVKDPVIFPAGYASSSNFQLHSTISQLSIGTSSATSFKDNSGFLYFPFASKPSVSATSGDGEVSLSWSSSNTFLGWSVSGYNVGYSTSSGGPYVYTSVGLTTSSNVVSLTNGTTYYFVVRVQDAFGNYIATSTQVSATPSSSGSGGGGGGSGGGGGGGGGYTFPIFIPPFGTTTLPKPEQRPDKCTEVVADLNCDTKVNLIDFSIMIYWYEKTPPDEVDLYKDGKINISDFSIMAYYWTE